MTFACFPVFVCLLEPLFNRLISKNSQQHQSPLISLCQALLCLIGVILVVYQGDNIAAAFLPIMSGLLSAFSFALLTLFNKQVVRTFAPLTLSFYQNLVAAGLLLPILSSSQHFGHIQDWLLIALLGIVFTALAHTLLISALQHVTAFIASLTVSLEPIYGIAAAAVLLNEALTMQVIFGASMVLAVNVWATFRSK